MMVVDDAFERPCEKEVGSVMILRPNGMVERLDERQRRPVVASPYGREKEGSPKDERNWKIARDNDRRAHDRRKAGSLRGRLLDVNT